MMCFHFCFCFFDSHSNRNYKFCKQIKIYANLCQDFFKKFWRHLAKTSSRHLQDVFKTFWRHLKTSSRHLQDVFKMYHQVKLFLLTRLREVFNTFLWRSFPKMVIYKGICLGNTFSEKFMVSVKILQER